MNNHPNRWRVARPNSGPGALGALVVSGAIALSLAQCGCPNSDCLDVVRVSFDPPLVEEMEYVISIDSGAESGECRVNLGEGSSLPLCGGRAHLRVGQVGTQWQIDSIELDLVEGRPSSVDIQVVEGDAAPASETVSLVYMEYTDDGCGNECSEALATASIGGP